MGFTKGLIISFLFSLCCSCIIAQSNINVDHYTQNYGASYRWVYDIAQDDMGFMWFANHTGLRRYDGNNFVTFQHSKADTNSLSSNTITRVTTDHKGNVWASGKDYIFNKVEISSGKINRFLFPKSDGFLRESEKPDLQHFGVLSNGDFIAMFQNNVSENVYGECTLWRFNYNENSFEHLMNVNTDGVFVDHFTENAEGEIWLWSGGKGFFLVDFINKLSKHYKIEDASSENIRNYEAPVDHLNNFWYPAKLTDASDQASGLKNFQLPSSIDASKIDRISVDNKGGIWFYYNNDEVYRFDIEEKHLDRFVDPVFKKSRRAQLMFHYFVDQEGAFWNGHFLGAIRFTEKKNLFTNYLSRASTQENQNVSEFSTREIVELSPSKLIVKENNSDIYVVDLNTKIERKVKRNYISTSGEKITHAFFSMVVRKDGYLWLNQADRLLKLDINTGLTESFKVPKSQYAGSLEEDVNNDYWPKLFEDASGKLWWCDPLDLYVFDDSTNKLRPVNVEHPPSSVTADFKFSSYNALEDQIYATYSNGVYIINCKTESINLLKIFPDQEGYDVLISSFLKWKNEFWLSTNKGLIWYNPLTKAKRIYNRKDGLPSNIIYKTLASDNSLWLSTASGLCKFDPNKLEATNYNREFGLLHDEFNIWSALALKKGDLYFGGPNGFIGFDPETFTHSNKDKGELHFIEYSSYRKRNNTYIRSSSMSFDEDEIMVDARNKNISFKYVLTMYRNVGKNQFSHFLEGYDQNWIYDGNRNEVSYNRIPPGNYTFHVKASGPGKTAALNELSIPVTVNQNWYKRWWAIGSYILLFAYGIKRLYEYQIRQKMQNQEILRIKEIDQLKTNMYTNITHEFRTPLTVILGMNDAVKNYAISNETEKLFHANNMINRNGRNLIHLINQLLDLSKLESGKLDINNVQENIVNYLKYLMESFQSYAAEKKIEFHFHAEDEEILMDFDKDKVSHIISNIISNAIKFTPKEGDVYLNLRKVEKDKTFLEMKVKDTGIGIESNKLENIFDRFYQVEDGNTRKGEGTGIGLFLVRELVKLLDGSIAVDSSIGKGTEFAILLPISNNAPFATENYQSKSNAWENLDHTSKLSEISENIDEDVPLVLIVEDNPDVIHYIGISLVDHYRLVFAQDGSEGIDKAIEIIPDLIISDVMMPKKDGYELCETLKNDERTSHIPIILLTAKIDEDSKLEGLELGADAYLAKPFNRKELLIRIKNLLTVRAELQKRYASIDFSKEIKESPALVDPFLIKAKELILENIEDEEFNVMRLCKSLHISRAQLHRKLVALTGHSTTHLIRSIQLEKAQELLASGSFNVSEVAYQIGFKTQAHFSRVFTEAMGINPSDYLKKK